MPSSSVSETGLLTGASGFTGRYLEPASQARGYRVVRLEPGGPDPCDLTDPHAVKEVVTTAEPQLVIHLAAVTYVAHHDAEDSYRVNVLAHSICCKHSQG
jgi:nucleoside-diphosphate-sugar epimerase